MIKLLKEAIPIYLATFITMISIFINVKIVGSLSYENYYILSIYLPINFVIFAIHEAFRATIAANIYFYHHDHPSLVGKYIDNLLLLTFIPFILIGVLVYISQNAISVYFKVPHSILVTFIQYTEYSLCVSLIGCWSIILLSILIALHNITIYWCITVGIAVINNIMTYLFAYKFNLNLYSVILSSLLCSILILFSISLILINRDYFKKNHKNNITLKSTFIQLIKIGMPIFLAYMTLFLALISYNYFLSKISVSAVTAFGIAYRLQSLISLPAIAIGIVCAYHVSELLVKYEFISAYSKIKSGIILSLIIYSLLSVIIFIFKSKIIAWIVSPGEIYTEAVKYFRYIAPSYVGLGPLLTSVIILEQTGRGLLGLGINTFYFSSTLIFARYLAHFYPNSESLYVSILIINLFFLFIILTFLLNPFYKLKRTL